MVNKQYSCNGGSFVDTILNPSGTIIHKGDTGNGILHTQASKCPTLMKDLNTFNNVK